jgi:hypothetical protein
LSSTVTSNAATAAAATALKENSANKSTDVTLSDATNVKFPTELAVKTFVNNQIASGTATNVSGVVAIANGGTGSSTQNFVDLTTAQTVSGVKTFSNNLVVNGTLTTGNITYPTAAGTNGQVLTSNGSGAATWVSATSGTNSIISKIADAPNTILSIGGFEFRYNSNSNGGFIEVRSNGSDNMMVFCQKNTGSWDLGGSTSTQNYRNNTFVYSSWQPVISLWNGSAWNDRVTLSVYDSFDATMFSMGNGGAIPNPLKSYKIFASIDGYNQVFIKVDYSIK